MKNIILLILILAAPNLLAANIPVTIKATADDDFVVFLTQGNTRTRVFNSADGSQWKKAQTTTINVNDRVPGECSIDFVTWSGISVHAMAASITGNLGTIYSGDPLVKSYKSGVRSWYRDASPLFPDSTTIDSIFSSLSLKPTIVNPSTATWGPVANTGIDSAARWISIDRDYENYFQVHRFPCGSFAGTLIVTPPPIGASRPNLPDPPVRVIGDHFSCYTLEKGPNLKPEIITITDKFGAAQAALGMPKMICNPSEKTHGKQKFGIENKERHLVCYDILEQSTNKDYELEIHNQFEKRRVRSTNRELFCVPSFKKHL